MFKRIKNLASEQTNKIIRDPVHASRTAVASILMLGVFSLSLNLGSEIMPDLFEARLIDPLNVSDIEQAAKTKHTADKDIIGRATDCEGKRRLPEDAEEFLNKFEISFSGILPGMGNLISSYPSVVSDRKEQLTLEVLKKYANSKFCIPEESFETLYLKSYYGLNQLLSPYLQVRLYEIEAARIAAGGAGPNKYPLDELSRAPLWDLADEFSFAEKDLRMTEKQIVAIIDRAIDSAIELDNQTSEKVTRLTSVTNNNLTVTTNEALRTIGEIGLEDNLIGASISGINSNIRQILAIDETNPMPAGLGFGGDWIRAPGVAGGMITTMPIETPKDISTDQEAPPDVGMDISSEVDDLIASEKVSYGLFNLFRIKDRFDLAEHIGSGLVLYAGASLDLDPFTPGNEDDIEFIAGNATMDILDKLEDSEQLCNSIEPPRAGKTCFTLTTESINP